MAMSSKEKINASDSLWDIFMKMREEGVIFHNSLDVAKCYFFAGVEHEKARMEQGKNE